MKKEIARVHLDEDVVSLIEYAYFMKESDEELLKIITTEKTEYGFNKEIFDHFYERYLRHRNTFELRLREAGRKYFGDAIGNENTTIEVKFIEGDMCLYED